MVNQIIKLSVLSLLVSSFISQAQADSFLLPVSSSVCVDISKEKSRSDTRYQTYDKATYVAIKTSSYMQNNAKELDDYNYNVLAYELADKALNDVSIQSTRDDDKKICLKLFANLDIQKADEILQAKNIKVFKPQNVEKIAKEVNTLLPKSIYENDNSIPLLYIKDLEFFNKTTSSAFRKNIAQKLSFEPRVLVTESKELADYFLVPKLLQSKSEKIDEENSRFSMSIRVEIQRKNEEIVDSETKNRYIIISNKQNTQEIAQKLLTKLLSDALDSLANKLNSLLQY